MKLNTFLVAASLLTTCTMASAVPVIYFGEDQSPGASVPAGGNAATARSNFLAGLSGVGNEDFESFSNGQTAPLALSFPGSSGSITATLNGTGNIISGGGICCGRFPTSGATLWEVSGSFGITFSQAISAFGFYGTDIGDFSGQITLGLAGGSNVNLTVPNTINGNDGSLLFYGFIDPSASYTSITFGNTNAGTDFFGFDDMVIGDAQQIIVRPVPEPGILALMGAGLVGLFATKRRKQA